MSSAHKQFQAPCPASASHDTIPNRNPLRSVYHETVVSRRVTCRRTQRLPPGGPIRRSPRRVQVQQSQRRPNIEGGSRRPHLSRAGPLLSLWRGQAFTKGHTSHPQLLPASYGVNAGAQRSPAKDDTVSNGNVKEA